MENPLLMLAEALKPVSGYRYFSTRMCAVGVFLYEEMNLHLTGVDERSVGRLHSGEKGYYGGGREWWNCK